MSTSNPVLRPTLEFRGPREPAQKFQALAENISPNLDWDDSQTDLAHLGGVAPGAAKSEGDKLWEDNWDDDDIEEEFSVQLR